MPAVVSEVTIAFSGFVISLIILAHRGKRGRRDALNEVEERAECSVDGAAGIDLCSYLR